MAVPRALKTSPQTTKASGAKTMDGASQSVPAGTARVVADMLRDLQIDGKALSARIERLRQRFA